jgi:hypothetical protein
VLLVALSLSAPAFLSGQSPSTFINPNGNLNMRAFGAYLAAAGGIGLLAGLVFGVCLLLAEGAVVVIVDGFARGERRSIGRAIGDALRVALPLLGAAVLAWLGLAGLALLSVPLLVLWVIPGLFGLVPAVALLAWLLSPGARQPFLKWLILLTSPFGLPTYYGIRWSLYPQAVVLEGAGPRQALQRSSGLIRGSWLRVFGITAVIGMITWVLQAVPSFIVSLIGLVIAFSRAASGGLQSFEQTNRSLQLLTNAASLVGWILFGALVFIGLTLVFLDQRNRREGADLAERLGWVEAGPPAS